MVEQGIDVQVLPCCLGCFWRVTRSYSNIKRNSRVLISLARKEYDSGEKSWQVTTLERLSPPNYQSQIKMAIQIGTILIVIKNLS